MSRQPELPAHPPNRFKRARATTEAADPAAVPKHRGCAAEAAKLARNSRAVLRGVGTENKTRFTFT